MAIHLPVLRDAPGTVWVSGELVSRGGPETASASNPAEERVRPIPLTAGPSTPPAPDRTDVCAMPSILSTNERAWRDPNGKSATARSATLRKRRSRSFSRHLAMTARSP